MVAADESLASAESRFRSSPCHVAALVCCPHRILRGLARRGMNAGQTAPIVWKML